MTGNVFRTSTNPEQEEMMELHILKSRVRTMRRMYKEKNKTLRKSIFFIEYKKEFNAGFAIKFELTTCQTTMNALNNW